MIVLVQILLFKTFDCEKVFFSNNFNFIFSLNWTEIIYIKINHVNTKFIYTNKYIYKKKNIKHTNTNKLTHFNTNTYNNKNTKKLTHTH